MVKRNIFKNLLASGIRKFLLIGEHLFLVPFFLTVWGAAYYGEWLTLIAFPSIISLSNVGVGTAAANSFVLKYANGNYQEAKNTYYNGLYLVSYAIIGGTLLGSILMLTLHAQGLFDNLLVSSVYAIKVVSILMIARLINFYSQLIEAKFLAVRLASFYLNIRNFFILFKLLLFIVFLFFGAKMLSLAIIDLLLTIAGNLTAYIYSRNKLDHFKGIKTKFIFSECKEIISKGIYYMLNPLSRAMFFQGSTIMVRTFLGPEAVAIFNTVRTLTRSINQVFGIINTSIFPEIQFEYGNGNLELVRKIFRLGFSIVTVLSIIGIVVLGFFGLNIYEYWTMGKLKVPMDLWCLFLLGALFNTQWSTVSILFRAANQPRVLTLTAILGAGVTLLFCWILIPIFGLLGAAFSLLLMELIMSIILLIKGCKIINQPLISLYTKGFMEFWALVYNYKSLLQHKLNKVHLK